MKKTWKKILCSLMLAPCMFWAVACGDNPDDPNNLTVDLTTEQQQEAYTTLRTLVSSTLSNDGSKDQAYTFKASNEFREVMDISKAGLSVDNKALVEESYDLLTSDKRVRNVFGGYKTNNTGYITDTFKVFNSEGTAYINNSLSEVVKYNGQYYELYKNENENKVLSRVSNVYAKEAIVVDSTLIANNQTRGGDLLEVFSNFENKQDFAEFKSGLIDWTVKTLALDKVQDAYEQDFSEYVSTSYKFSLTDGVYTLKVDLAVDATDAAFVYTTDGVLKGDGSLTVAFDNNSIKNLAFNYASNMVLEQSAASVFSGVVEQEFASDNVVTTTNSNIVNLSLDFTTAFDNKYYNQTLTGYAGTGVNGAVENNQINATIIFIDNELEITPVETKLTTGENFGNKIYDAIVPVLLQNDLEVAAYCVVVDDGAQRIPEEIDVEDLVPATDVTVHVYFVRNNVGSDTQA